MHFQNHLAVCEYEIIVHVFVQFKVSVPATVLKLWPWPIFNKHFPAQRVSFFDTRTSDLQSPGQQTLIPSSNLALFIQHQVKFCHILPNLRSCHFRTNEIPKCYFKHVKHEDANDWKEKQAVLL